MAANKGTWIGGAAFIAVAIGAGTWFLGVSPQAADAADLRAQTEQVRSQNDLLELQIASLESESEKLPEYEAELAVIRTQIPTTAQLSEYLRQVNAMAAAHAVFLTNIAPATGQAFVPALVAAPAPAPTETAGATDTESGEATDEETPTAPAAPSGPRVPDGFAAIPFSLTVLGTYDNTLAFINDLQTVSPRLFLVSALTATALKETEASGGRPATAPGDQELVITGYLYVLPDPAAGSQAPAPEPTDPSATPTPTPTPALPAPVPGKNPLIPIAGE